MFYEAEPTWPHYLESRADAPPITLWSNLEKDPLGRENLESRISHHIHLLLRSEGGDGRARDELRSLV